MGTVWTISDIKKANDDLIRLIRRMRSLDFVSHGHPLLKIKVACRIGQLLKDLLLVSHPWNDEDLVVSCFIQFYCYVDFLGH
jgi:hypothetical protein